MSGDVSQRIEPKRAISRDAELTARLLGERIRLARLRKSWTEAEAAERARISRATLQKIEKGGLGVAVGLVLEVCAIVGVPLFGADDAGAQLDRTRLELANRPKRVRRRKTPDFDDDF